MKSPPTTYQSLTDDELVDACLRKESEAWEELIYRFSDLVYSIPLKRCRFPKEDAEDIYQSTFQTIFERLDTLHDKSKLRSWIISIAWRKSIDLTRKETPDISLDDTEERADSRMDLPTDTVLSHEREGLVREALDELSDIRAKAIIEGRFYEGMSYKEISRNLKIPMGSIGPILGRGLDELRRILVKRGLKDYR